MLNQKKLLTKILENLSLDFKAVKYVELNASGSIASGGTSTVVYTDISSYIPDGYELVWAQFRGTGNHNFYCWFFNMNITAKNLHYRVHNAGGSAASVTPTASILCKKKGT